MRPPAKGVAQRLPTALWGELPPRMRVLFVSGAGRTGGWLAKAFAADSASDVTLQEAVGMPAGLACLRDEVFDAVLISHCPGELDALELLDALRTGSSEQQPIIVLGTLSEREMTDQCFEAGADAYVCVDTTTTRTLIWHLGRATERHRLVSENRRLRQSQRHRLELEHDEANRLLAQQRALIEGLEQLRDGAATRRAAREPGRDDPAESAHLPQRLTRHYHELLRAHVIMGSGNLNDEMTRLADLLVAAGVTAGQTMQMHLQVVEQMVDGLGSRSARHVMNRADLLVLEVMIHLAEGYRRRLRRHLHPPRQLMLAGFDLLDQREAA